MVDVPATSASSMLAEIEALEAGFRALDSIPPEIEKLAAAQTDHVLADWIRDCADPVRSLADLVDIRRQVELGMIEEASAALARSNLNRIHVGNMLARHVLAKAALASAKSAKGGEVSKRREWADLLAEKLTGKTKDDK